MMSASAGLWAALGLVAIVGLISVAAAAVASAVGNPSGGVFAATAALGVATWQGGPIDGWLWRASLPGAYGGLIIELFIWLLLVVGMIFVIDALRQPIRARWRVLAWDRREHKPLVVCNRETAYAGALCAAVAGVLALTLLRSSAIGQVVWSLVVSFLVGGVVAQMAFPKAGAAGILISPALVALVGYVWVWLSYDSSEQVLAAWYAGKLPGLALGLPIHYLSAAVAGSALGAGWGQAIARAGKATSRIVDLAGGPGDGKSTKRRAHKAGA